MQILLGLLLGAVVGLAVHFVLPYRDLRGTALAPVVGAAAAAVSWTALTWAGIGADSFVIWLAAVIAAAVTSLVLVTALSRARVRSDAVERARHGI